MARWAPPQWFPTAANPGPSNRSFQTRRGSLQYVFTASSRTVNTLTFEANSSVSNSGDTQDQTNYAAQIGLTGIAGDGFPVMQLGPYLGMGQAYPFSRNARNVYTWTDGLSTKRGKHTLRVSGQYARQQVNSFWPQYPAGLLSFNAGLTSLPGIVDTGDALASFLLGMPYFAEETIDTEPSYFRRVGGLAGVPRSLRGDARVSPSISDSRCTCSRRAPKNTTGNRLSISAPSTRPTVLPARWWRPDRTASAAPSNRPWCAWRPA